MITLALPLPLDWNEYVQSYTEKLDPAARSEFSGRQAMLYMPDAIWDALLDVQRNTEANGCTLTGGQILSVIVLEYLHEQSVKAAHPPEEPPHGV